jgi:hypothetical protein
MELITILTDITLAVAIFGTICILIQFAALCSAQRELRRLNLTTHSIYYRHRKEMARLTKNTTMVALIWISFWLLYLSE